MTKRYPNSWNTFLPARTPKVQITTFKAPAAQCSFCYIWKQNHRSIILQRKCLNIIPCKSTALSKTYHTFSSGILNTNHSRLQFHCCRKTVDNTVSQPWCHIKSEARPSIAPVAPSFQPEILQIWLAAATTQERKVGKPGGTCSPRQARSMVLVMLLRTESMRGALHLWGTAWGSPAVARVHSWGQRDSSSARPHAAVTVDCQPRDPGQPGALKQTHRPPHCSPKRKTTYNTAWICCCCITPAHCRTEPKPVALMDWSRSKSADVDRKCFLVAITIGSVQTPLFGPSPAWRLPARPPARGRPGSAPSGRGRRSPGSARAAPAPRNHASPPLLSRALGRCGISKRRLLNRSILGLRRWDQAREQAVRKEPGADTTRSFGDRTNELPDVTAPRPLRQVGAPRPPSLGSGAPRGPPPGPY